MSKRLNFGNVELENIQLEGKPSENVYTTAEKIELNSYYSPNDLKDIDHLGYVSGKAPFLRGPYGSMYAIRPWTVRQYAGFSTAEESNAFYRRNLAAGQKGLSVAFDLATFPSNVFALSACLLAM